MRFLKEITLENGVKGSVMTIRQKTTTLFEVEIGSLFTALQGFGYFLALTEVFSI